jgi:hypothetical protein
MLSQYDYIIRKFNKEYRVYIVNGYSIVEEEHRWKRVGLKHVFRSRKAATEFIRYLFKAPDDSNWVQMR